MLPAKRVRRDAAPYLHEATHVLVPKSQECLWPFESFASYVQSYVASAERCAKALGSMIKAAEIQFHHEVTNQYLWIQF